MATYDLTKEEDRVRMRKDRIEELTAVEEGRWPRDVNDLMRWSRGTDWWAAQMCTAEIQYLDDLEERLNSGEHIWG